MSKYKIYRTDNNSSSSYLDNFRKTYTDNIICDKQQSQPIFINPNVINIQENMQIPLIKITNNPNEWGCGLWKVLHLKSFQYPEIASPIFIEGMKNFILGLPYILPCETCFNHCLEKVTEVKDQLNDICSGRDKLSHFFVDFHNSVNIRLNKRIYTYDEAKQMYSS